MKLMLKKLLITLSLVALLATNFLVFLPSTARAQAPEPWYDQGPIEWYLKVFDESVSPPAEIFGERYTAAQVNWIIWSILSWIPNKILRPERMICILSILTGGDVAACLSAAFVASEPSLNVDLYAKGPDSNKGIVSAIFADRPLSGITYVKNIARKFKLIPEVKAQGFGFTTALDPILPMWRGSRDIAYTLFVFITIVFAFMIMFRVKISPQTVITVQSALPKLAVAIILVTFSYAIAGFLVDLMYVVIGLVALLSNSFIPGIETTAIFNFLTTGAGLGALGLVIVYLIAFGLAAAIVIFLILGAIISLLTITLVITVVSPIVASVGSLLAVVILVLLVVLVLWHAIRITWMLLKAFTSILLLTIFAPFQIAIGTLVPNFGFSAWVKSMVSSLAVFVVAGVLFVLSFIFLGQAVNSALESVGFGGPVGTTMLQVLFGGAISGLVTGSSPSGWPPLISTTSLEGTTALLFLGVSMVLFMSIPKAADIIKGMIEGRPFAYGTAIGQAMAPVGFAYGQVARPIVAPFREASGSVMALRLFDKMAGSERLVGTRLGGILTDIKTSMQARRKPG